MTFDTAFLTNQSEARVSQNLNGKQLFFPFYDDPEVCSGKEVVGVRVDGKDYALGEPVDLGHIRMVILPVDYQVARGSRSRGSRRRGGGSSV